MSTCPLTGKKINLRQPNPSVMEYYYETPKTGKVLITDVALMTAPNLSIEEKQILSGMCRNHTIKTDEPLKIKSALLQQLRDQEIPYGFEERAKHFLQYLYDNGGKEYKSHIMDSEIDSSITYSSRDEFERIIAFLESEGWITYKSKTGTQQCTLYQDLRVTKSGIQQVEKALPKMPLFSLVNQDIVTGDFEIDKNIQHARLLFFGEHCTLESKRSACEALSFILEPYREDLKKIFDGDTEVFFRIVNDFTIRHNKERTKNLQHEEQIEWIFYCLLNTVNTYVKMKRKVGQKIT
ncbi:MAG: hypothetical protein ABIO55_15245 [Ginsengibacter sp.]